jgi:hypothetical protein
LGDEAYSSRAIRAHLRRRRIKATIPEPADQTNNRGPCWTGACTRAERGYVKIGVLAGSRLSALLAAVLHP